VGFREIRKNQPQAHPTYTPNYTTILEEAEEMAPLVKKPAATEQAYRDPTYVQKPMRIIDHSSPDAIDLEQFEYVGPKKSRFSFHLPKLPKLEGSRVWQVIKLGIKVLIGCALIYLGLTTTGSFFGPASGKFAGDLAMVFYRYQLGNLVAMAGVIVIYDAYIFR